MIFYRQPKTTPGRIVVLMLWLVVTFAVLFGIDYGASSVLNCEPNEAGAGVCMLGSADVMTPLSVVALFAGAGLFLLSPILILLAIVAALVCLVRRSW
jgi:hypothetical protein